MAIQDGVSLVIAYRKESSYGVLPANDSTAQILRRTNFGLSLTKDSIRSAELRSDLQRPASRHAMRKVGGDIAGELSLGTYAALIGSTLRRDFAAVSSVGPLTDVTASATAPHFTRATGSWITAGLRVGMPFRMTGWTSGATANNDKTYTIQALTATQISVAETVTAKASGDSITLAIPGKGTYIPATAHTDDSYSFEEWAPKAAQSLRFLGCKMSGFRLSFTPNDKVSITFSVMGQDRTKSTTQYFSSATAAGTSQMQTSASGAVYYNGAAVGILTAFDMEVTGNAETLPVAFSAITPDVLRGALDVSGSFSVAWQNGTFDDAFDQETEAPLVIVLRDSAAAGAEVLTLAMPFVKLSGGDQPEAEKAIIQSMNFTARVNSSTSGGYEATTLMIHDTLAA